MLYTRLEVHLLLQADCFSSTASESSDIKFSSPEFDDISQLNLTQTRLTDNPTSIEMEFQEKPCNKDTIDQIALPLALATSRADTWDDKSEHFCSGVSLASARNAIRRSSSVLGIRNEWHRIDHGLLTNNSPNSRRWSTGVGKPYFYSAVLRLKDLCTQKTITMRSFRLT